MIAICPNPYRDIDCRLSLKAIDIIKPLGKECCICPVFAKPGDEILPAGIEYRDIDDVVDQCELVVVIGGDGTILNVARHLGNVSVPILGVNLGTKGFMANIEPEDLEHLLEAAQGKFKISRRMMLDVSYLRDGELIYSDHALNDVVIHGCGDCININALCNGNHLTAFSGDGIIVSTPTGSTGYSMSAGGPIVEPEAENIIISPICAHMMSARSFVLGPNSVISIDAHKLHDRRANLSVDGNYVMDISNGDTILVKRSENYTIMADLGLRNFYEFSFEKLR
jgi:NAD+ kinase